MEMRVERSKLMISFCNVYGDSVWKCICDWIMVLGFEICLFRKDFVLYDMIIIFLLYIQRIQLAILMYVLEFYRYNK